MPKCRKRKLEDILMKFKSLKQFMPFQINKKLPKKNEATEKLKFELVNKKGV